MSSTLRSAVRLSIATDTRIPEHPTRHCPADLFGKDVFGMAAMREHLPSAVFKRLEQAARRGKSLSEGDADIIAGTMKDWAIARGATHYTHWFQPMTGTTAEKHDAFLTPAPDGRIINEFSGKMLIKGEPDASSFPSGGIRSTFEARGYTAWDPTSPAFLLENTCGKTLYIPCIFLSYTGESLDRKTPLLRSLEAVSAQALRVLRLFGNTTATKVNAMVGAEQEYFLVDSRYLSLRSDLLLAGRTVYGAKPSKGQELEDHYFGAISPRVLAFMAEVEERMLALGIPARTRHNEVAPGQFELAPMFEAANLATDHNMLTMEVLKSTAERHGFACLLHEKPFAGVNGSGKHNNWSLCDSEGNNLLDPGTTPANNAQFLIFLAAILRAVHKHSLVLRLGTIGAGNDHRLGANEAPPAIISVFLGEPLTNVLKAVIDGNGKGAEEWVGGTMQVGVTSLPPLPRDISDRNRTSPFAFTGNKFEFRAVGSSQSIAPANIALNSAVACALDDIATELESAVGEGIPLNTAAHEVLARLFKEHMPIVFNANGYSEEWQEEAARRGLPNCKDTVSALEHYSDPEVMAVFSRTNVLSEREQLARQEILLEAYIRAVHVETKLTSTLGRSVILPAAMKYLKTTAKMVQLAHAVDPENTQAAEVHYHNSIRTHVFSLLAALDALDACHEKLDAMSGTTERAAAARDSLLPLMQECRSHADLLEAVIDDADWPLPKYNELLWQH
ncbi:glutamine synthetase III [Desulfovibrio sp. OttesenSCG-928-G15]|nr:glutamine synthetase III [Desulfovibrio sp. OttesenSCG-928-G15]